MYRTLQAGPAAPVFVDTSAFVAYFHGRDRHTTAARGFFRGVRDGELRARPLLTSEYVLDETATTLLSHAGRDVAVAALEQLRSSTQIRIRHVDPATFDAACEQFVAFDDQPTSFTDHVIGIQARADDADYVLSFDRDFEVLGLTTLPEA